MSLTRPLSASAPRASGSYIPVIGYAPEQVKNAPTRHSSQPTGTVRRTGSLFVTQRQGKEELEALKGQGKEAQEALRPRHLARESGAVLPQDSGTVYP